MHKNEYSNQNNKSHKKYNCDDNNTEETADLGIAAGLNEYNWNKTQKINE